TETVQTGFTAKCRRVRTIVLFVATIISLGCAQQPNVDRYSSRVTDPYAAKRWSSKVFTTAHASFGDAAKHFVGVKPKPQQPIQFPHNIHTFDEVGIECIECHSGVKTSTRAGMPGIELCMSCHEYVGNAGDARIQLLRAYAQRGEEMPWQRVYGFLEESHVRF